MKSQENKDRILERIVAHFTKRMRDGKYPSIERYKREFPDLAEEIEEVLSSVAMIEELKQVDTHGATASGKRKLNLVHKKLGDYRVVRELGRGGMGVVFEAVHESLGRRVAIKILPESASSNPRQSERFLREAQAAANLHHTNIVTVFGVGQQENQQYYVMEFIDGENLSRIIDTICNPLENQPVPPPELAARETVDGDVRSTNDSWKLSHTGSSPAPSIEFWAAKREKKPWHWAADLGAQIADALVHAHQHGILHRDIKPSNLMLDGKHVVWITDFGLVKNLTNQSLTKTGDLVGTPQYMAPEAFEGKYDERSETYCLGLTLYELATLKPAFQGKTTHELIASIATSTPEPPRRICPHIPRDLSTIIEKAIQREPADRYQTAVELRDDLRAFLTDQPILARRSDPLERAWRWTRKNPLVTSLMTVSAILICLVAITATTGYLTTQNALNQLSIENRKLMVAETAIKEQERQVKLNLERVKEQYDRAETNVALTLEMLDHMFDQIIVKDSASLTDLQIDGLDELSEIRTSVTAEDARFLEEMLVFYERFALQNSDNADLMLETASAYRRVANIYQLIGEASKAEPAYLEAIQIYQERLKETEELDNSRYRELTLSVVRTRNDLAFLLANTGKRSDSARKFQASALQLEALSSSHPDVEYELAKTFYQLSLAPLQAPQGNPMRRGDNRRQRPDARTATDLPGEFKPAPLVSGRRRDSTRSGVSQRERQAYALSALELFEKLRSTDTTNVEYELFHAKTLIQLASNEIENREKEQDFLKQAKWELQQLKERYPDNPEYEYALGIFYFTQTKGSRSETLENMQMANKIGKELFQSYPLNIRYRQLYATTSYRLARHYHEVGDNQKARENHLVALSMWNDLSNETDDIRYFYQKTYRQYELANELVEQEKLEDAKRLLLDSIDELQSDKIHQLATRYTERFHRPRPGPQLALRAMFRDPNLDKQPREDEFWRQYRKRLIDHYTLLSSVLEQLGDPASSTVAKKKISQLSTSDLKKGIFPSGT